MKHTPRTSLASSASIAVLFGDQTIESRDGERFAGQPEAFPLINSSTGSASSIVVFIAGSNKAKRLFTGLYADTNGNPGALVASGSLTSLKVGAWNSVPIHSTAVKPGKYWLAILGEGGALQFRARGEGSCHSETSRGPRVAALPSTWQPGATGNACPISAYVDGTLGARKPTPTTNGTLQVAPTTNGTPQTGPTTTTTTQPDPPATLPPLDTGAPTITGSAVAGDTLTASVGTWADSPTSYAYQWQDCTTLGLLCTDISNATANTYTLAESDVGDSVRLIVTGANSAGSTSAASAQTAVVTSPPAPENTAVPAVSGSAVQGATLSTTSGGWSNNPTSYSYAWQDCNSSGASCTTIGNATANSYALTSNDVGHTIRAVVTATNAGGSNAATSAQTAVVTTPAPSNTTPPAVTGQTVQGQTLTTSNGSWSGSPSSYAYQWDDCNAQGQSCSVISGATASTYTLTAGDVGDTLRAAVSACNGGGCTSASSAATGVVSGGGGGGSAPQNTVAPYFTPSTVNGSDSCTAGCAIEGQQLSVASGTWTSTPTSYSYQWEDCSTTSAQPPTTGSCSFATGPGATSSTYTVSASDVGYALVPIVTATNGSGSASTSVAGSCDRGIMPAVGTIAPGGVGPHLEFNYVAGCSPISAVVGSTQANEEICTNSFTTCGLPDPFAGTAGVPLGTSLTPYSGPTHITTAGTTIDDSEITSPLTISANNVTIENSDIDVTGASGSGVQVSTGVSGILIEHTSIHGTDANNGPLEAAVSNGDQGSNPGSAVTLNGVYSYNTDRILNWPGVVENSVCLGNANISGEHYECIYYGAGTISEVLHSVLLTENGETAAYYSQGDFGTLSDIAIENSLLGGGDFCVYGGTGGDGISSGETITGNRLSRAFFGADSANNYTGCGSYGLSDYMPSFRTSSGNVWDDTLEPANP